MIKRHEIRDDTVPLTVRLGETDDEEPVLLYRVPLSEGGDRCLGTPSTGRTWEYLVSN